MTDEDFDCDLCGKTDVSDPFIHQFRRGLSDVTLCAHCLRECAIQFGVYENNKTEYQTTLPKEVECLRGVVAGQWSGETFRRGIESDEVREYGIMRAERMEERID